MALWQYNLLILPEKSFDRIDTIEYLDNEGFIDDEFFWRKSFTRVSQFDEIASILPRRKSWSDEILLFGTEESNRLEIFKDNKGFVLSVSLRIDFTSEYEDTLRKLLRFFLTNGMIILDENLQIVRKEFLVIDSLIKNSKKVKKYEGLRRKKQ